MKLKMALVMKIALCAASGRIVEDWTENYDCMWDCIKRMQELESDNYYFYHIVITDSYGVVHFEDALM